MAASDPFASYRGKLDDRFLDDDRLPQERRLWLAEQFVRGEIDLAGLLQYVNQYLSAPQTVAPAGEPPTSDEVPPEPSELTPTPEEIAQADTAPDTPPEVIEQMERENAEAHREERTNIQRLLEHEGIEDSERARLLAKYEAGELNDATLKVILDSADEDMEEQTDPSDLEIGVGTEAVISTPGLVMASDLLPSQDDEVPPPPDASAPPPPGLYVSRFRIEENRFPTATQKWAVDICHSDGTMEPLEPWLSKNHPDWNGGQIAGWLINNGLPEGYAIKIGKRRDALIEETARNANHPALQALAREEEKHFEMKDAFSKAYVEAQKKKQKKA